MGLLGHRWLGATRQPVWLPLVIKGLLGVQSEPGVGTPSSTGDRSARMEERLRRKKQMRKWGSSPTLRASLKKRKNQAFWPQKWATARPWAKPSRDRDRPTERRDRDGGGSERERDN